MALPDDIRQTMLAVQEKAGFVPNVFLALAHRPAEFRAFFAYHDALMLSRREESHQSRARDDRDRHQRQEGCLYCVVAHGALLRIYSKNTLIADQVAVNHLKADITPRQKAMLDFAIKVCLHSDKSTMQIMRCWPVTGLMTRMCGISPPSPHFSACRTGWRT